MTVTSASEVLFRRQNASLFNRSMARHMTANAKLNNDMMVGDYDRWAPVYDFIFGPVFPARRQVAIEAAEKIGGRIL